MQSHLQKLEPGPTHVIACLPVYKMRRREFPTLEFPFGNQGRGVVAYRSLAVGAGNVYRLPWELNIFQELADPFQAGLDHGLSNVVMVA